MATVPLPLSDLMRRLPDGEDMRLGELIDRLGSRAHGTALLLLSLPDSIPLPLPSVGAVLGIPLALISLHLAIFGDSAHLPQRLSRWRLPARGLALVKRYVVPLLARAEAVSAPRLAAVADQQRLVGLVCLVLSLVLLLPIPFMNTPPSVCLALLAWGVIQRDGLFVLGGLVSTAALGVALTLAVDRLVALVT